MDWIEQLFGVQKPVIGMCHLEALPGDPAYDAGRGMGWVAERARQDMLALQSGGVDAVMFSNERSLPYKTRVDTVTTACMAGVIAEIKRELHIPFGVNVLWDAAASIDLAVATGASFVREIFTGVYASDFGLWNTNCGEVIRHQYAVHAEHVKLLFNIFPESSVYLAGRSPESVAWSTVFNTRPDGLCVSGLTAGVGTDAQLLGRIKRSVPEVPVFANTGVNLATVEDQLGAADGAIVGTYFKRDGCTWNEVDEQRTRQFMDKVKAFRSTSMPA
jgi:membrane complex biogenesis BtpA family protein